MADFSDISADPLYLTALASLGADVPAKFKAQPADNSIAVLPFINMSDATGQEHFVDGLTEDIITDLSNVAGFFVISRNSTFAYKGKPTDVRQIAHDLGVKYILEGSARRAGQRLRINVQLIDASEGGNHVWAERFDRELSDIFEVQDEVSRRVVEAITGKLTTGPVFEKYRTTNMEAYDLCVKSRGQFLVSKSANQLARANLEKAIALDPAYAEAHYELALSHLFSGVHFGDSGSDCLKTALDLVNKAIALDPRDPSAYGYKGYILVYDRKWDEAGEALAKSLEMNSNNADTHAEIADFKFRIGKLQESLMHMYQAFRLNPRAPEWYYWTMGETQIELGQYEDAVKALDRPEIRKTLARRVLAAALALSGRTEQAKVEASLFMAENPDWTISQWTSSVAVLDLSNLKGVIQGYRLAGLPESSMTNFSDISADPLYLTALAKLGTQVPAKLGMVPSEGSIAVMPFVNMMGEPEQEFFADGLTEDIITDLSNVPGFFVIARNSVFAYKNKPTDVRQIAHDLGVKYILEGSARRSSQRLRINVQLTDAALGGNHVWAERFDRDLADIFEIQDEVTRRVVEAITGKINLRGQQERLRPANLEAYDLVVRSRNQWTVSKSSNARSIIQLEHALALEPHYCEAHWQLAFSLLASWLYWGGEQQPNRGKALDYAQRAVAIDPKEAGARWALAKIYTYERRWDEAQEQYDVSFQINPNAADALGFYSDFLAICGRPKEAVDVAMRSLRLNPHAPSYYYWSAGFAQIADGQYQQAVQTLQHETVYENVSYRLLGAAFAMLGRADKAQEMSHLFLAANPHWRISTWVENVPFKNQSDADFWINAYRLAGLPE